MRCTRRSCVQKILAPRKIQRRDSILEDRDLLYAASGRDRNSNRGIKKHSGSLCFLCRSVGRSNCSEICNARPVWGISTATLRLIDLACAPPAAEMIDGLQDIIYLAFSPK